MKSAILYAQPNCKKSDQLKKILSNYKLRVMERDITEVQVKREMIERTGGRSAAPQVIINGQLVGGYDELTQLEKKGTLKQIAS